MSGSGVYKMRTVAEQTGFSPALLRAWERRHGLLQPERTGGGHRLYTDDDLRVLERVKQLLDKGRAIGEIASIGREGLLARPRTAAVPTAAGVALERWCAEVVAAAVELDEGRLQHTLDEAFAVVSAPVAIARVVDPALREIGELWAAGRCSVAGEHLASAKIMGRLLKLIEASNPAANNGAEQGICACLPGEQHEIGALVAGYQLTRYHYRVAYLGASLPLDDLERSCRLLAPAVVCLSVARAELLTTHERGLMEMARRLKGVRLLLGGAGASGPRPKLEGAGVEIIDGSGALEAALKSPPRKKSRRRQ